MKVTDESLYERYDSLNTEALADLYHAGGLTDLGVNVLKEVIASRGLDWAQFTKPSPTEPESRADWSLWKSKFAQASIDEKRPTVADVGQPVGKDLVGIRGWLFFYTILRSLGVAVLFTMQWRFIPDVEERLAGIFVLTVVLVGLYLLIGVRKPITRYYHIGFNCFFTAIFAIFSILTPSPLQWFSCAESFIWVMFWIKSKRVRATYCQDSGTVVSS